jgi:hypothetical protein
MRPSRFTSHPRGRCAADFIALKKSMALAGFKPATFGSSGKHTNHYTTEATDTRLYKQTQRKGVAKCVLIILITVAQFRMIIVPFST